WTITNGVCSSFDDVSITVKRIPDVSASNQQLCSGTSTNILITNPNTVSGTTFSWIVQNSTNTTGASGGNGDIISQVLTSTNGTSDGTVVYRITPTAVGCSGTPLHVTVTVKPVPVITNTASELSKQICSSVAINFSPSVNIPGTTFTWTSTLSGPINPASVNASGAGNIGDAPVNTGNVSGIVTYHITPSFNGCNGSVV